MTEITICVSETELMRSLLLARFVESFRGEDFNILRENIYFKQAVCGIAED